MCISCNFYLATILYDLHWRFGLKNGPFCIIIGIHVKQYINLHNCRYQSLSPPLDFERGTIITNVNSPTVGYIYFILVYVITTLLLLNLSLLYYSLRFKSVLAPHPPNQPSEDFHHNFFRLYMHLLTH